MTFTNLFLNRTFTLWFLFWVPADKPNGVTKCQSSFSMTISTLKQVWFAEFLHYTPHIGKAWTKIQNAANVCLLSSYLFPNNFYSCSEQIEENSGCLCKHFRNIHLDLNSEAKFLMHWVFFERESLQTKAMASVFFGYLCHSPPTIFPESFLEQKQSCVRRSWIIQGQQWTQNYNGSHVTIFLHNKLKNWNKTHLSQHEYKGSLCSVGTWLFFWLTNPHFSSWKLNRLHHQNIRFWFYWHKFGQVQTRQFFCHFSCRIRILSNFMPDVKEISAQSPKSLKFSTSLLVFKSYKPLLCGNHLVSSEFVSFAFTSVVYSVNRKMSLLHHRDPIELSSSSVITKEHFVNTDDKAVHHMLTDSLSKTSCNINKIHCSLHTTKICTTLDKSFFRPLETCFHGHASCCVWSRIFESHCTPDKVFFIPFLAESEYFQVTDKHWHMKIHSDKNKTVWYSNTILNNSNKDKSQAKVCQNISSLIF